MPPDDVTSYKCGPQPLNQPGEETMATTNTSGVQLLRKLEGLEHRRETLASPVKGLERHTAELDDLGREIGNLKLEVSCP